MQILHGTWLLDPTDDPFIQDGAFYLWAETAGGGHPGYLSGPTLQKLLCEDLSLPLGPPAQVRRQIVRCSFLLPAASGRSLPSPELARFLELELPTDWQWQPQPIDCYRLPAGGLVRFLHDLHFLIQQNRGEIQLGGDLLFWHHCSQFLKAVIYKDHYIPALRYRKLPPEKGKKKAPPAQIYPGWQCVGEQYEAGLRQYAEAMPLVCTLGSVGLQPPSSPLVAEDLLRHFCEVVLNAVVTHTPLTAAFDQQLSGSLVADCLSGAQSYWSADRPGALDDYRQWQSWQQKLTHLWSSTAFVLCLQLEAPEEEDEHQTLWQLSFLVASRRDPSWRLSLFDYWSAPEAERQQWQQHWLGSDFEANLLLALGYAARMCPLLWAGLRTSHPVGLDLEVEEAFAFLQDSAWVLEEAGFRVLVPAWWTPEGRRRARIRLKATARQAASAGQGLLNLQTLIDYQYELSIGDQSLSESEWQKLIAAKLPLVQLRGQWLVLEAERMQQMLEFWRRHREERPALSLLEWMKLSASESDLEFECDAALRSMLDRLSDQSRLIALADPPGLVGRLRPYQQRGLSWLTYLEQLGLGGCLADDMGLGKSLQVIARLLHEKAESPAAAPTLLIAPTSVLGNWRKEIEKFAPQLKVHVHHGSGRPQTSEAFQAACRTHDVVLSSYTLVRKDERLFGALEWQRLVIDEAQNIKNPKAGQTRAIQKLPARSRLALTGTPIENRLLDLWSIFQFLNPGYLGNESQFRKRFELPIQKENDREQAARLKRLIEPLVLRRVKSDPNIIRDLPDKIEQKLYCQLTREQASLYAAVLKDVEAQIEQVEGIARKGLILATLTRLKQICNHPMQFLQDNSPFSPERSHKLSRLGEMIEEVIAEGESLLVFSQFREIGAALERHLRQRHYNTYFLHGGVSREKRERQISEFQDPDTGPSVFILSLKAGGVGITLTRANHVFHFDRWWNPAVEDQATDRAFRIGQIKNVFVHKFVVMGTLEERIDQMIEHKKQVASAIVGADESWLSELDNERFKELIALSESALLE
ncbi:DEAD/DEAH box helicase [Gloeobacter kilaueensis]|uniref:Helicase, SNF2/RAD54 n=1 Tax=Gloeobacter kilaueensis (strain ATCC BAA-2537 / CCAP 1431/1 / ULC 316 / JS1) TaxID=1183438 RepID=U5QMC9_GLOK1|nr:DEAD/DEAH box helicase [Gloeobacter kilaueensis]AGY60043.1 helicase, SNF2/RAD54 [Gloeobacter kilaueensis JS1]